ncbi:hypothetical protein [Thalassotalea ganghwensis]
MIVKTKVTLMLCLGIMLGSGGCTSVTVDQVKHQQVSLEADSSIVVIGRRAGSDYETEPELVSCIGDVINGSNQGVSVVPEQDFVDTLYPWFEARTAPAHIRDLKRLLAYERVSQLIEGFNVKYIVWVDGNTEKTRSAGSISCGLAATGVACFGFGTWDTKAEYEATIWDYKNGQILGKVSSVTDGTSYVPAVVVPIPLIAPVQGDACKAMAAQLNTFFSTNSGI